MTTPPLEAGQKVRITQTIATREGPWQTEVEGEVVSFSHQPTGSWFAHGKNDKLWLARLCLRRADGELVDIVLDSKSRVSQLTPQGE